MSLERFQRESLKDKHIELEEKEKAAQIAEETPKKVTKVGKIKKAKKK